MASPAAQHAGGLLGAMAALLQPGAFCDAVALCQSGRVPDKDWEERRPEDSATVDKGRFPPTFSTDASKRHDAQWGKSRPPPAMQAAE